MIWSIWWLLTPILPLFFEFENCPKASKHFVLGQLRSQKFFAKNFLQKRDTASCVSSFCSARQDASNDMHFDLFWLKLTLRSPQVTWPEVKFWPWSFRVKPYIFWRVSTRGTRWRLNYGFIFIRSKVIVEKQHCQFSQLSLSIVKCHCHLSLSIWRQWRHLRGHHLTRSFKYWYCRLPPVNSNMLSSSRRAFSTKRSRFISPEVEGWSGKQTPNWRELDIRF